MEWNLAICCLDIEKSEFNPWMATRATASCLHGAIVLIPVFVYSHCHVSHVTDTLRHGPAAQSPASGNAESVPSQSRLLVMCHCRVRNLLSGSDTMQNRNGDQSLEGSILPSPNDDLLSLDAETVNNGPELGDNIEYIQGAHTLTKPIESLDFHG